MLARLLNVKQIFYSHVRQGETANLDPDELAVVEQGLLESGTVKYEKIFGCDSSPRSPNVRLCVRLSVRHTCYSCCNFSRTSAGLLQDFCRTFEGLLKNF